MPGARSAQRLVGRRRDDVRNADGAGVDTGRDEAGEVRHVDDQLGAHDVGDLTERVEVVVAGVRARSDHDDLGHDRPRHLLDLVHVDAAVLLADPVLVEVVEAAREVDLVPVGQVTAVREGQPHRLVARLHQRGIRRLVGGRAGVRLHVDVNGARTEQLLGAFDREDLDLVHDLTSTVVPLAGQAFGVLVGQDGPGGLQARLAGEVLAGDHLERLGLTVEFGTKQARNGRIGLGDVSGKVGILVEKAHAGVLPGRRGRTGRVYRRAAGGTGHS